MSLVVMEIPSNSLFIPSKLGPSKVTYNGHEFTIVREDNSSRKVHKYDLPKELRDISMDQLQKCLQRGYLSLNQIGEDYSLRFEGRLKGGGPVFGWIGYWATKAVCYGTALAAGTAAITATGGAVAGPVGAAAANGAFTIATGASAGAGAVAGAIGTSAAATTAATQATVAVVGGAGTLAGAAALVESAAWGVGGFFAAIPFLP